MNKPIINPLWIYLSNIIPNLGTACIILGIVGIFALVILFFVMASETSCDIKDEEFRQILTLLKKYAWIPCVLILFGTLIPNQRTIYGMMITNYVTPANIESVGDGAKDVVDYIFEKIDEVKEKE